MTVHQLRDAPIAVVNGKSIALWTLIRDLKLTGMDPVRSAIQHALVLPMAEREGISVSDAELQEAADKFRQAMGLYSQDSTTEWLEANGLTVDDLERKLERDRVADKLKRRVITDDDVETFYNVNRPAFDWAHLSQIVVDDENRANTLYQQLVDGGGEFDELARSDSDDESWGVGGYLGMVTREELTTEAGRAVFDAEPGTIVGPLKTDQGYHLIKVWGLSRGELSAQSREHIKERLFKEWLDDQASTAAVELLI